MSNVVFFMGVSGTGKTSIATSVAQKLGMNFIEGDDLHPLKNKQKMAAGIPLTDQDRWPWLKDVAKAAQAAAKSGPVAITCSMLKREYRDLIREYVPDARIVYLHGSRELLEERISARQGHFFDPTLLYSQLDTLEVPQDDENAIFVDVKHSVEDNANFIASELQRFQPSQGNTRKFKP